MITCRNKCHERHAARNLSNHHPFGVRDAPSRALKICEDKSMNGLIYLVGLIVVIMAVLSLFGLR